MNYVPYGIINYHKLEAWQKFQNAKNDSEKRYWRWVIRNLDRELHGQTLHPLEWEPY